MEWKDVTSYSQSDKEHKPRAFECKLGRFHRVCIVWGYRGIPDEWVMHMYPLFDCMELGFKKYEDLEAAKTKSLSIAKSALVEALEDAVKK